MSVSLPAGSNEDLQAQAALALAALPPDTPLLANATLSEVQAALASRRRRAALERIAHGRPVGEMLVYLPVDWQEAVTAAGAVFHRPESAASVGAGGAAHNSLVWAQAELERRRAREGIDSRPVSAAADPHPHAPVSVYDGRAGCFELPPSPALEKIAAWRNEEVGTAVPALQPTAVDPDWIRHYPSISLAALKTNAPAYRVWLAVRHQGLLTANNATWIDRKAAVSFIVGKLGQTTQRAGQILQQGEGLFWDRDKSGRDRLWLRGAAAVARGLGVETLSGQPVAILAAVVYGRSLKKFRATLAASFHTGRKHNRPISRAKIREATGVPERTQRHYDRLAGVERQTNITVTGAATDYEVQKAAYDGDTAVFVLRDYRGKAGAAGADCLARQLPNSYSFTRAKAAPGGRKRKIAKQLNGAESVRKGARANSGRRLFWHSGELKKKGKAGREAQGYLQYGQITGGRAVLWRVLE